VHDALREQLDHHVVRLFADLAEHPRGVGPGMDLAAKQQRAEFIELAWGRTSKLIGAAQRAWLSGIGDGHRAVDRAQLRDAEQMAQISEDRLRAAMRIPALEGLSPAPWSGAARRVLPSPSPQRTATAMWGPVLAWAALELLAESIDPEEPEQVALKLFDRLRLRDPFAHAFANLGFEGEDSWRAAARIKVVLLTEAEIAKRRDATEKPAANANANGANAPESIAGNATEEVVGLPAVLWNDPDVRWLTGAHESHGHLYLVREPYEELLWWMLMPSLLRLAGEPAPSRAAVDAISRKVKDALAQAEAAGYRIDVLVNPAAARDDKAEVIGVEVESQALEEEGFSDQELRENETSSLSESTAEPAKRP